MHQLSVSQVGVFDEEQYGGCPRRWWFEYPQGLKSDPSDAQSDGTAGHKLIEHYLKTSERPGRARMGKAVNAAIINGRFPTPGPDLEVERRITGQPRYDEAGNYVPLIASLSPLWAAGVAFDGYIDIAHQRDIPTVIDVKFSADIHTPDKLNLDLMRTVQLPGYGVVLLNRWGGDRVRLGHLYISRKGVDSRASEVVVTRDQVIERWAEVERTAKRMIEVEPATNQDDVPFNRKSCNAWMGCPHQSICSAFKEKKVALTADELALFEGLDKPMAPPPAPAPAALVATAITDVVPAGAPPEVPKPAPAPKSVIMPACADCGADLNPENAATLRDGGYKHIGCPAAVVTRSAETVEKPQKRRPNLQRIVPTPEPDRATIAPSSPPAEVSPKTEVTSPTKNVLDVVREEMARDGGARIAEMAKSLGRALSAESGQVVTLRVEFAFSPETLAALRAMVG